MDVENADRKKKGPRRRNYAGVGLILFFPATREALRSIGAPAPVAAGVLAGLSRQMFSFESARAVCLRRGFRRLHRLADRRYPRGPGSAAREARLRELSLAFPHEEPYHASPPPLLSVLRR